MGTKFTVYDSGVNPMKTTSSLETSNLRQELAAICYVSTARRQRLQGVRVNFQNIGPGSLITYTGVSQHSLCEQLSLLTSNSLSGRPGDLAGSRGKKCIHTYSLPPAKLPSDLPLTSSQKTSELWYYGDRMLSTPLCIFWKRSFSVGAVAVGTRFPHQDMVSSNGSLEMASVNSSGVHRELGR